MVYLNNNTELQEVWIPKNDGTGSAHKTKDLESVDVTISQDITIVRPSSGYYGMSAVTIDATEYGQQNYDSGFDDGYIDGYASGSTEGYESGYTSGYTSGSTDGYNSGVTDGEQSIIDTFTSTTITENGQYGSSANPYSAVTVNVSQTGHTDQELQDAYDSGYTSGSTDGFNSGYTSGETHQKSLLVSTAFTENGEYTRENGYSAITVNVPQPTGASIEANKVIHVGFKDVDFNVYPTKDNVVVTEMIPNKKYTLEVSGITDNKYVYLGYFKDTSIQSHYEGYSIFYDSNEKYYVDASYDNYPYTATTVGNVLTIEFTYPVFEWFGNGDGNNYDVISSLTMNFKAVVNSTDLYYRMQETYKYFLPSDYFVDYFRSVTINCEDVANSARTSGYTDGYSSGYTSGATDGFNSGYTSGVTDGENNIISTFSSMTATTNGVYGSSANPLSSITVNVPQTGHTDQELEDAFESGYTSGSTDGFNSGYTSGETHQKSLLVSTAFTQNGIYSKEDGYSAVTVNVPQQTANLGVKTITANGTYSASTDNLDGYSAITVNISAAKKLYVTVNDVKQNVQYYSEEATVWKVVNENYTTDTPLEIFYVHYYEYKFHIYLLPSGKYGYWDEDENSQQPQTITTINGSATTQDSRSTYTMEEDGNGLIVTSNNGSFYEVLVSEEVMNELSAITITSNTAITVNNGGYSAITVNVDTASTYNSGYTSGYTDGYSSGYTSGYTDGHDETSETFAERTYFGAYYPIDSATDKSYYTVFPNLVKGQKIMFQFIENNVAPNSIILGGSNDLKITFKRLDGFHLDIFADSADSISYRALLSSNYVPNSSGGGSPSPIQLIFGEIALTDTSCEYSLNTKGITRDNIVKSGTYNNSYQIVFNPNCVSGLTLQSLIYKDVVTQETLHYYTINPETFEIEDLINDSKANTYDYNNNIALGVLQPKHSVDEL